MLKRSFQVLAAQKVRASALFILSLTAFSTVACSPDLQGVDADAPVPTDQTTIPEDSEVGGTDSNANDLIGETITVSTKVTEVISPNLFTIYDVESLRGEEILAITDIAIPSPGTNIEVTGEISEIDEAAIESAYGVTLTPELIEAYTGRPYLAVKALEPVD